MAVGYDSSILRVVLEYGLPVNQSGQFNRSYWIKLVTMDCGVAGELPVQGESERGLMALLSMIRENDISGNPSLNTWKTRDCTSLPKESPHSLHISAAIY